MLQTVKLNANIYLYSSHDFSKFPEGNPPPFIIIHGGIPFPSYPPVTKPSRAQN